jgi:LysR family transcriptional regulator, transcriptional activator for bauABCD operon
MTRKLSDVDLRLLRVFRTVVECGGFSAAETELNIQRSTISTHMADLESRLGCRLCRRGRAGFALTDSGRVVYEAVVQLFSSIDHFNGQIESAAGEPGGHLNIGIVDNTVSDSRAGIVEALARLKTRAPGAHIAMRVTSPTEIERELLDGQLHVGVAPFVHPLPGLHYAPLYQECNSLYCARGHELFASGNEATMQQVLACDYVARGYEGGVEIRTRHLPFRAMATARSMEGAATLILTGKYLGYLPVHYALHWVNQGLMRILVADEASFDIDFNLITRRGVQGSRLAAWFIDELRAFHESAEGQGSRA